MCCDRTNGERGLTYPGASMQHTAAAQAVRVSCGHLRWGPTVRSLSPGCSSPRVLLRVKYPLGYILLLP